MVYAFVLTKEKHNDQLRARRDFIRNYLRSENERYYHKRGVHWKPSKECSYLTLRLAYRPDHDEEELWLTGRQRPKQVLWGTYTD